MAPEPAKQADQKHEDLLITGEKYPFTFNFLLL